VVDQSRRRRTLSFETRYAGLYASLPSKKNANPRKLRDNQARPFRSPSRSRCEHRSLAVAGSFRRSTPRRGSWTDSQRYDAPVSEAAQPFFFDLKPESNLTFLPPFLFYPPKEVRKGIVKVAQSFLWSALRDFVHPGQFSFLSVFSSRAGQ